MRDTEFQSHVVMKELLEKYFDRGDYKIIEDTNETIT